MAAFSGVPVAHLPAYFPVAALFAYAAILTGAITFLTWLLGPKKVNRTKLEPFECGSESSGWARERFGVKFYVIALLFIVFDIEAVFLYPWAVIFKQLGMYGLVSMSIFAFTLVIGLVYVWKKGALEWE